ncbi:MAG: adenosylcobinamide-phosphate synthase CbiB [bacterium]
MEPLPLFAAYALDLLLGDPRGYPHPVVIIGRIIRFFERTLRKWASTPRGEFIAGVFLVATIVPLAWGATAGAISLADLISPLAGKILSVLIAYTTLATRDLHREASAVAQALKKDDIDVARRALSMIVGRDTERLDPNGMTRALVETIAENTSDGIVAPILYLSLGGPPLAMAYKAVNTLDSMVGYKNERYIHFGRASAKVDDLANYIPARITGALMVIAALLWRMDWRRAWKTLLRDGRKHESPNSGLPEAAAAGALGVQLGGPNYYEGILHIRPTVGDPIGELSLDSYKGAVKLMYTVSLLSLALGAAISLALSLA